MLCQEATDASERAARTHANDDGIDVAMHLPKDFGSGRALVRLRISGIGKLIDVDRPGGAGSYGLGKILIIIWMAAADI